MNALKAIPGQISEGFKEAWIGLRSPDRPTRRMAVIFYLSIVGLVVTAALLGNFVLKKRAEERAERVVLATKRAEAEAAAIEARRQLEPPPYQSLGTFSLELREEEGVARTSGLRMAEMEMVIACSDLSVCAWMESHLDLARGSLGSLFTPTDRERILSPAGKKAFREEVRDALNHLLEERGVPGTVIEVLFPRFLVS